jgi:hypothetical protein
MRSSRNRAGIVAALLALAMVVLGTGSAGASQPVAITSPADGVSHAPGFSGPIEVDFTSGDPGTYTIGVTGPHGYAWSTTWNFDGSQTTNSWPFPQARLAGTCRCPTSKRNPTSTAEPNLQCCSWNDHDAGVKAWALRRARSGRFRDSLAHPPGVVRPVTPGGAGHRQNETTGTHPATGLRFLPSS